MAKRKPIIPSLSTAAKIKLPTATNKRRPLVPSQTTLSVQDVSDYSTPAGAAMANEEMRRLRMGIESLQKAVENPSGETDKQPIKQPIKQTPGTNVVDPDADDQEHEIYKWALTLKSNGIAVDDPKVVQAINFVLRKVNYSDKGPAINIPVLFTLTKEFLENEYKTQNDAVQIKVIAEAVTHYIDWVYLRDQTSNSITVTANDIITFGVFKGLHRRTIALVNDEEFPEWLSYYGTDIYSQKGWHKLPTYWQQPVRNVADNPNTALTLPVGSAVLVEDGTGEWLGFDGYIAIKTDTPDYYVLIEPVAGDTVINLHVPDLSSDANAEPKIYTYYNAMGVTKWRELFGGTPPVVSGDKTYIHTQNTNSTEWYVYHDLDKKPAVQCEDINGVDMDCTIEHIDLKSLRCHFAVTTKGFAYCN